METYDIGDKVWLEVKNLCVTYLPVKLALRQYGSFVITQKVSGIACHIALPKH